MISPNILGSENGLCQSDRFLSIFSNRPDSRPGPSFEKGRKSQTRKVLANLNYHMSIPFYSHGCFFLDFVKFTVNKGLPAI